MQFLLKRRASDATRFSRLRIVLAENMFCICVTCTNIPANTSGTPVQWTLARSQLDPWVVDHLENFWYSISDLAAIIIIIINIFITIASKIKGTWTRRGQTKLRQVVCCLRIQPCCGEPLNPPSGCKDFDHLLQLLSTQTSKKASSSLVIVAGSFSARRRQFNKLKRRFFFSPKASSTWWLSAPSIVDWNIWTDLVTNKQCLLCQAMSSTIWDNRKSCFKFCLHYLTFDFYFLIIVSFSEMLMLPRIYRVIKCNCVLWFVTDSEMAVN